MGHNRYDAVVVGAGMGGLMSAALLANRGLRVAVAERSNRVGGYQCRFDQDGLHIEPHFHFLQDAGPGRPVRRLLDELGIDLAWKTVDPLVEFIFPDQRFRVPADRSEFIASLTRDFPAETAGIDRLFTTTKAIFDAAQRLPRPAPVLVAYAADTVADLVGRFVRDPRLRTILGGWAAYFGYGATKISGPAIAVFTESCFHGGVLHPVGGITTLADALQHVISSHGGDIHTGHAVQAIQTRDSHVTDVLLDNGRQLETSTVISNVDARTTLDGLVRDNGTAAATAARLSALTTFRSPFSVHLGLRPDQEHQLEGSPVKVVFPSDDTDAQDRAQLAGDVEHAPLSLGIPTLMNPGLAPAGHDIALLYTFLPRVTLDSLLADPQRAQTYADRIVGVADRALPGLSERITSTTTSATAMRDIYTPNTGGALGWAPDPAGLLGGERVARGLRNPLINTLARGATRLLPAQMERLAARSPLPDTTTKIQGLYLCGQWTRFGPGMNNVFMSSAAAASAAVEHMRS